MKKLREENEKHSEDQLRLMELINQAIGELKEHRQLKSQKSTLSQSVLRPPKKQLGTPRASANPQPLMATVPQQIRNPQNTHSFSTPTKVQKLSPKQAKAPGIPIYHQPLTHLNSHPINRAIQKINYITRLIFKPAKESGALVQH